MSCNNGSNYRRLCFYDEYNNTCNNQPHRPDTNWTCVHAGFGTDKKMCVKQHGPVRGPNSYRTRVECEAICSATGPMSWSCKGNRNCVAVREEEDVSQGRFDERRVCRQNCPPKSDSLSWGCKGNNCVLLKQPVNPSPNDGMTAPTYGQRSQCQANCGSN